MNWMTCLLGMIALTVYANDEWEPRDYSDPYETPRDTHNLSDDTWSPEIRGNSDADSWHTINRWQGRIEPDRPEQK
jgi:hypothetical protein